MLWNHSGRGGDVSVTEMLSVLRHSKSSDLLVMAGKLIGVGLFAALVYSYCNVLIETLARSS